MPTKPTTRQTAVVKLPPRPLRVIAKEIQDDILAGNWRAEARYYARPYLEAMHQLDSINDVYYMDSGKSIVRYFLSNAATWRGETARRIKLELGGMLK